MVRLLSAVRVLRVLDSALLSLSCLLTPFSAGHRGTSTDGLCSTSAQQWNSTVVKRTNNANKIRSGYKRVSDFLYL